MTTANNLARLWQRTSIRILLCACLMSGLNLLRTPFFGTAYSFQVLGVAATGLWLSPLAAILAASGHAIIEAAAFIWLGHLDASSLEYLYRQSHFGFAVGAIIAAPTISFINRHLPKRSRLLIVTIAALPASLALLVVLRADFSAIYLLTMARSGHRGLLAADTGAKTFTLYLLVYALAGLLVMIQYLRHMDRARTINICLAGILLQYIAGGIGYFTVQSFASSAEWLKFDRLLAEAALLICVILRMPADVLSLTILASLWPQAPASVTGSAPAEPPPDR